MLAVRTNDGAERRRFKRFQVDVPGTVQVGGREYPVMISDISTGGALVNVKGPLPELSTESEIILNIEHFGPIPAKIVRSGKGFWGVCFSNPLQYRFRLIGWLQQEADD